MFIFPQMSQLEHTSRQMRKRTCNLDLAMLRTEKLTFGITFFCQALG